MAGGEMEAIEVTNMDSKTMEQVVNYMHGIPSVLNLAEERNKEDTYELLEATERLQMEDIKKEVGGIIGGGLSI